MSDLRTEIFTKVLPKMQSLTKLNFDDPEQPEVPITSAAPEKVSNNERIFNWVKDHPASTSTDVVQAFDGYIQGSSVVSQLYTLAERKLLHKVKSSATGKYMYSAAVDKYPANLRAAAVAKMQEARAKISKEEMARRISEGHKASVQKAEPPKRKIVLIKRRTTEPTPEPAVQVTPVDLNKLSIVQARKLYDELKQIFGA